MAFVQPPEGAGTSGKSGCEEQRLFDALDLLEFGLAGQPKPGEDWTGVARPKMTADQALQLLFLHQESVRQSWDQPHRRKRRGEPWETYTERLRAMWVSEKAREAEDEALRRLARAEGDDDWDVPGRKRICRPSRRSIRSRGGAKRSRR